MTGFIELYPSDSLQGYGVLGVVAKLTKEEKLHTIQ